MTAIEAFLQDILTHPDDTSIVLIFADWLEDQGDPRAKMLRESINPETRFHRQLQLEANYGIESWIAQDKVRNQTVLLKRLRPPPHPPTLFETMRLWCESEVSARCQHACLLPLQSMGFNNGCCFLTLPYVEGIRLYDLMNPMSYQSIDENAFVLDHRILVFLKIAQTLQQVHEQGILHCDLGPHSVLIENDLESIYVTGWLFSALPNASEIPLPNPEIGVFPHVECMPPEIVQFGSDRSTSASDIYGLGVIFYYLLTGAMPIEDTDNFFELAVRILEEVPQRPRELNPKIPPEIDAICMRCLEHEPSARYPTVASLIEELHQYLAGEWELPEEPGTLAKLFQWCRSFLPGGRA